MKKIDLSIFKKIEKKEDDSIILINVLTETSCFMLHKGKVLFAQINYSHLDSEGIETSQLSLETNVFINTIENNPTFDPGYFNIVIYNGEIDDEDFESFIELCSSYAINCPNLSFNDFFTSLINIFQLKPEKSFENLIGFFGELSFIKRMYDKYNICLANCWHNTGSSFDKYDFVANDINVEIKTTCKEENIFKIKHSQLFNEQNVYVCLINIENNNSGISLNQLIENLLSIEKFSKNFNFCMKIAKERNKINKKEAENNKFIVNSLNYFSNKTLRKIVSIPDCISNISYNYNFENEDSVDETNFVSALSNQL